MKKLQMEIKKKLQVPTSEQIEQDKASQKPKSALKSLRNTFTQLMNSSTR
jgi:hypothetical protein